MTRQHASNDVAVSNFAGAPHTATPVDNILYRYGSLVWFCRRRCWVRVKPTYWLWAPVGFGRMRDIRVGSPYGGGVNTCLWEEVIS